MTQEELDKLLASGRQIVTFGAGILTALGIQTFTNPQDLITDFDHMVNGAKEFMVGAGPLIAAAMVAWSRYKASRAQKIASVSATPGTMVITATPSANTVAMADKIATLPEVKSVISTPAVATATASSKVVSP
jgi:hypothetical protein